MNKEIIGKMLVDNARKAMLENVDKIDDVKFLQNELKEHLRKEFDLQQQLEEKDRIINKVEARLKLLGKYEGKTCTRNFKMMSADFNQLLEILERGKNANSK